MHENGGLVELGRAACRRVCSIASFFQDGDVCPESSNGRRSRCISLRGCVETTIQLARDSQVARPKHPNQNDKRCTERNQQSAVIALEAIHPSGKMVSIAHVLIMGIARRLPQAFALTDRTRPPRCGRRNLNRVKRPRVAHEAFSTITLVIICRSLFCASICRREASHE